MLSVSQVVHNAVALVHTVGRAGCGCSCRVSCLTLERNHREISGGRVDGVLKLSVDKLPLYDCVKWAMYFERDVPGTWPVRKPMSNQERKERNEYSLRHYCSACKRLFE